MTQKRIAPKEVLERVQREDKVSGLIGGIQCTGGRRKCASFIELEFSRSSAHLLGGPS